MKFEYLYIEKNESVSQVAERVLNSSSKNCVLFVPEDAESAKSLADFRLLAREAKAAGKNIFINSESEKIRDLAGQAGLMAVEYQGKKKAEKKGPAFILDIAPPRSRKIDLSSARKPASKEGENKKRDEALRGKSAERNKILIKREKGEKKENKTGGQKEKEERKRGEREEETERIERENIIMAGTRAGAKKRGFPAGGKNGKIFFKICLGVIVLAIIVFVPFYFFVSAKVVVVSEKTTYETQEAVFASPKVEELNSEGFRAPAHYFEFKKEITKEFDATGFQEVSEKSSGTIKIYNAHSSSAQTLVATTRFLSNSGKLFRLAEKTKVPGAQVKEGKIIPSYIEAKVVADEAGESFNIGPEEFSIPGFKGTARYGKFYGLSTENMSGGFVGQAKVVSAQDLEKAKEELKETARISLSEEAESKMVSSLKILDDARVFEIEKIDFSSLAGERGEKFTVSLSASLKILSFFARDIEDIFSYQAGLAKPETKDKELIKANLEYGAPRIDFGAKQISFSVKAEMVFRDKMDEESFRENISGKSPQKAAEFFGQIKGVEKVDLNIFPGLSPILPWREKNIEIVLD